MPILNVFRRGHDGIFHFWGSELLYVRPSPGRCTATTICSPGLEHVRPCAGGAGRLPTQARLHVGVRQMTQKEAKG